MAKQMKLTEEQQREFDRQEKLAEEEATWPVWVVWLEGDEVEHAARANTNLDKDGEPQPYMATRVGQVHLRAKSEDMAKARALAANPEFHTITSAEKA